MPFRQLAIALCLAVLWAAPAPADEVLAPEQGIESTIQSQIDAFLADDVETAFGFASPMIRRLFGTSEMFGRMVQTGYPMVWRPGELRFLELREVDGALWQKVLIRDRAGAVHVLDYQMIATMGGWKINGVQILRAPGVGAYFRPCAGFALLKLRRWI